MLDEILLQLSVSVGGGMLGTGAALGHGRLQGHGWVGSAGLPMEATRPYELPCPVPSRPRCPWT